MTNRSDDNLIDNIYGQFMEGTQKFYSYVILHFQTCTNILEANQSSQEMTEDVLLRERVRNGFFVECNLYQSICK